MKTLKRLDFLKKPACSLHGCWEAFRMVIVPDHPYVKKREFLGVGTLAVMGERIGFLYF